MSSASDLSSDFEKLKSDAAYVAEENARLRSINVKMLNALRYVLPLLQQGLRPSISIGRKKRSPMSKMPSLKQSAILSPVRPLDRAGSAYVKPPH